MPLASDGFLEIFVIPWLFFHLNHCLHVHMMFSLCTCLFQILPFYKDTYRIGLGPFPANDLILPTSEITIFINMVTSEVLGVKTSTYEF